MNNRFASIIFIILAELCLVSSCVGESVEPENIGVGEAVVTLAFGTTPMDVVLTRAGHSLETESRVFNMHLFVFDEHGNKVASHFFSDGFKQENESADLPVKWWNGSYKSDSKSFTGKMRLAVPSGNGMKLYLYTNLDSDMVRVSEELLSHSIQNEEDLIGFQCYLNQNIVSRNILFPMTGVLKDVTIGSDGAMTVGGQPAVINLERIDAKIKFDFRTGGRTDEHGQTIKSFQALQWRVFNVPRTAFAIKRDMDDSTVPAETPVSEYDKHAKNFFDTEYVNFETFNNETGEQSFTFYMLENRQNPKNPAGINGYQDRSRQTKNADGTNQSVHVSYVVDGKPYERDMRVFANANDFSTYVMVKGKVTMDLKNDDAGQVLSADVTYLIHLGDWGAAIDPTGPGDKNDEYSNYDNFKVLRNTSYTYTVTVNSVNNIRVEVETSGGAVSDVVENQPGATGFVTIAREEIALCDAHYESKTLTFHLANFFDGGVQLDANGMVQNADKCVSDKLTWEVETPFSTGGPRIIDGIDITSGLDYRWVHFRLNKKDDAGNYYSDKRRKFLDPDKYPFEYSSSLRSGMVARSNGGNQEGDGTAGLSGYHNDGVFDIVALVKYMKDQVNKYLVDPATSDFDQAKDGEGNLNPKISVTVFVNEYYYEAHPLTGAKSTTLWKKFVNQPDRSVHILCNSDISKDLESRATGSVVTIQQHAIQCIYNTDEHYTSLQTAWGVEYTDEFSDVSSPNGIFTYNTSPTNYECSGSNTNYANGLVNSLFEWGMADGSAGTSYNDANASIKNNIKWGTYLNFEVDNSVPQMQENEYKALRYFCMARNRDNNGDGIIDGGEVRWYLASINQLIEMYIGQGLLPHQTRIYNRTKSDMESADPERWRQHVISSTKNSSIRNPEVLWGEEGVATSHLNGSNTSSWTDGEKLNKRSIRCVRNLGIEPGNINETPQSLMEVTGKGTADDHYVVKCTNLNHAALRYYTSRDLAYSSNDSETNRLYKVFEIYHENTPASGISGRNFVTHNEAISKVGSVVAGYCPEGYRVPNQLELAVMKFFVGTKGGNDVGNKTFSRTYWNLGTVAKSLGEITNSKSNTKTGFVYQYNITLSENKATKARCVRDIRVD